MSDILLVIYGVDDRILVTKSVLSSTFDDLAHAAEKTIRGMFPQAEVAWYSVTHKRWDGRIIDHGRYRGGAMLIDVCAMGRYQARELIPLAGTAY